MNKTEIYKLIDRYFEGDLSIKEERSLLNMLLSMPHGDAKIDEALAVMSWTKTQSRFTKSGDKKMAQGRSRKVLRTISRVAASAAVIITITTAIYFSITQTKPECYAYVDGKLIENRQEVESMISSQLADMGMASDETSNQALLELDEIREAIALDLN